MSNSERNHSISYLSHIRRGEHVNDVSYACADVMCEMLTSTRALTTIPASSLSTAQITMPWQCIGTLTIEVKVALLDTVLPHDVPDTSGYNGVKPNTENVASTVSECVS